MQTLWDALFPQTMTPMGSFLGYANEYGRLVKDFVIFFGPLK